MKKLFKRIFNIVKWIPILWQNQHYDYSFAVNMFIKALEDLSKFLDSDSAYSTKASQNARNIRRILKIMRRVEETYYFSQIMNPFYEKYGNIELDFIPCHETGFKRLELVFENKLNLSKKEIEDIYQNSLENAFKKEEKAHKLVWKLIGENIRNWSD
jgi:hypothetical protein